MSTDQNKNEITSPLRQDFFTASQHIFAASKILSNHDSLLGPTLLRIADMLLSHVEATADAPAQEKEPNVFTKDEAPESINEVKARVRELISNIRKK